MPATSVTDVSYLSKVLYPKGYDPKMLFRNKPLLNALKKKTDFTTGRGMEVPADYQLTSGLGTTVAGAVLNANASKGVSFLVPQSELDGYIYMDRKAWMNAQKGGDLTQFINYARDQSDKGLEAVMQELHRQSYGAAGGARAQVSATTAPSGTSITLANASDSCFFRPGMVLVASLVAGGDGGALVAGTPGFSTVVSVNATNGVLTMDGTVTTQLTGLTVNSFLYQRSIASNNGTADPAFQGLASWCPAAVTATAFNGIDRTINPSMLAGVRYGDTSGNLETLFIRARAQAFSEVGTGFSMGDIYLHPLQFAAIASSKEGARQVDDESYKMGINKLRVGNFTFVEDTFAPLLTAWCVADGAFELATCGDQPEMGKAWDDPDVGQVKIPLYVYGNFVARKPSQIMRITLPTPV